jgi:protein lin-37
LENAEEDIEKEQQEQPETESEESEKEAEDDDEDVKIPVKKIKIKAEKEDAPTVKETKPPRVPKQQQLPSYIMKLFDRSVNLARFDEITPLYPLCRAWMQNAPRALPMKPEKGVDPMVTTAEEGDVVEMPKVRIRKGGKPLVQRKDNNINKKDLDKAIDSEVWTKEKLLEFHRTRWQEERDKHIETSRNFEEKHFAANLELIETLIKGNEE